jgi:hypothetical protein
LHAFRSTSKIKHIVRTNCFSPIRPIRVWIGTHADYDRMLKGST